ncbi:DNA polymerase zeta catalytic subunit [Pelomyxa schiedti]|nr:DNA polymerase zeta catalytic subunit [Pelomyxa schiedti]
MSGTTTPAGAVFAVRAVSIDDVMVEPAKNEQPPSVPVLRIFGATPAGQKTCLHLHKAFPYFFVPFPDDQPMVRENVESYCRKLSMCIERAAHVANQNLEMSKPFPGNRYNTGQQHHHYVFKIVPVRGKPFYGYCPCEKVFLKTYIYNPQHVTRIVALLRSGAIMQTKFAVYEAHIPFSLQIFVDYNLFGMGLRKLFVSTTGGIATNGLPRTTTCELEVDASIEDLLNPDDLLAATTPSSGIPQYHKKVVRSLASMWQEQSKLLGEKFKVPLESKRILPCKSELETVIQQRIHEIIAEEAVDHNAAASVVQQTESSSTLHSSSPFFEQTPPSNAPFSPDPNECDPKSISINTQDKAAASALDFLRDTDWSLSDLQTNESTEDTAMEAEGDSSGTSSDDDPVKSQKELMDIMGSVEEKPNGNLAQIPQFDGRNDRTATRRHLVESHPSVPEDIVSQDIFQPTVKVPTFIKPESPGAQIKLPHHHKHHHHSVQHQPSSKNLGTFSTTAGSTSTSTSSSSRSPSSTRKHTHTLESCQQLVKPSKLLFHEPPPKRISSKDSVALNFPETQSIQNQAIPSTHPVPSTPVPYDLSSPPPTLAFPPTPHFNKAVTCPHSCRGYIQQPLPPGVLALDSQNPLPPYVPSRFKSASKRSPTNPIGGLPSCSSRTVTSSSGNHGKFQPSKPTMKLMSCVSIGPLEPHLSQVKKKPIQTTKDPLSSSKLPSKVPIKKFETHENCLPVSCCLPHAAISGSNGSSKSSTVDSAAEDSDVSCYYIGETQRTTSNSRESLDDLSSTQIRVTQFGTQDPVHQFSTPESSYHMLSFNQLPVHETDESCSSMEEETIAAPGTRISSPVSSPPGFTQVLETPVHVNTPPDEDTPPKIPQNEIVCNTVSRTIPSCGKKHHSTEDCEGMNFLHPPDNLQPLEDLFYTLEPPEPETIKSSDLSLTTIEYQPPFFSSVKDSFAPAFQFGGREIRIPVKLKYEEPSYHINTSALPQFTPKMDNFTVDLDWHFPPTPNTLESTEFTPLLPPPSRWCTCSPHSNLPTLQPQISSVLPANNSLNESLDAAWHTNQHLTHMSVEIHGAIDYKSEDMTGILILETEPSAVPTFSYCIDGRVDQYETEKDLLAGFVKLVLAFDPDIMSGYEIQMESIGYLLDRARVLGFDLCVELGRIRIVKPAVPDKPPQQSKADWSYAHATGFSVQGRILLNVWRLLQTEVKATDYTQSSMATQVLNKRFPSFSYETLTRWYTSPLPSSCASSQLHIQNFPERSRTINYYLKRVQTTLDLLHSVDLIGRTSELARIFGIDFFSVLSRGSQYRVESMLFRLTKPQNFILISPSKQQVAQQRAPECIPLVMEPISRMYPMPVAVFDFQSLYPSIIIAYNYCYSTCLGKVEMPNPSREKRLGASSVTVPKGLLGFLENKLNVSPNEVMFVNQEVRQGVLPRMLQEILETRVMIKNSMKWMQGKGNKAFDRMMNARQLGLKMIANVTYGYASAAFSGRMPCVDIADAIVETARQTLERAIKVVNSTSKWNAEVVYGDTDSMFVMLKTATRDEAFKMGQEIAQTITEQNPPPIKLQFEKLYHPCVLVTKKRYVGLKYDSRDKKPEMEAKGIELVRRDTCPLVQRIMGKTLRLLFDNRDLSKIKQYLERQWKKILDGYVDVKEFIFAKAVRLGSYENPKALPPAALVGTRAKESDHRAEPRWRERVRYVVVSAYPGARLADMVISPEQFMANSALRLNSIYYITKQVNPALSRVLNLVGANVNAWYTNMSRKWAPVIRPLISLNQPLKPFPLKKLIKELQPLRAVGTMQLNSAICQGASVMKTITLERYCKVKSCIVCGAEHQCTQNTFFCSRCERNRLLSYTVLTQRCSMVERRLSQLQELCLVCCGGRRTQDVECCATDCPAVSSRADLVAALSSLKRVIASLLQDQHH